MANLIQQFIDAIKPKQREKHDTYSARVSRVDKDGAVWVYLAGSDRETPTALRSTEVKKGDSVNVQWRNNRLYVAGNNSDPAAGAGRVSIVEQTAKGAEKSASDANIEASRARKIAGDTAQHFWMTETGTDTGAHITEKTKEEFLADPPDGGGNLLARSNGIAVRDGLAELAQFGADAARIGQNSGASSYMLLDYHSLQMVDRDGRTYLHISDLRDQSGYATISEEFYVSGTTATVMLRISSVTSLTVDDTAVTNYTFSGRTITFGAAVSGRMKITYRTNDSDAKAFTIGRRLNTPGPYSFALGYDVSATGHCAYAEGSLTSSTGHCSHAEGVQTRASGDCSHAQNYFTEADYDSQTVIGKYNHNRSDTAFEIGNGNGIYDDPKERSNAFTVDWSGNVDIAGTLTQASDKRLKEHIDYLDDEADEFVRSLQPAHYKKDGEDHVGFYAQDVEKADKWNCLVGEMNGYKTLDYTAIIAPLVRYCQHLEKRIEDLENDK